MRKRWGMQQPCKYKLCNWTAAVIYNVCLGLLREVFAVLLFAYDITLGIVALVRSLSAR